MFDTTIDLLLNMICIAWLAAAFAVIVAGGAYIAIRIIVSIKTFIREEL